MPEIMAYFSVKSNQMMYAMPLNKVVIQKTWQNIQALTDAKADIYNMQMLSQCNSFTPQKEEGNSLNKFTCQHSCFFLLFPDLSFFGRADP